MTVFVSISSCLDQLTHPIVEDKRSEAESTDPEEDEAEGEEGDELTPAAGASIFKTLAKIRDRDPIIYQKHINVFEGMFCLWIGKNIY